MEKELWGLSQAVGGGGKGPISRRGALSCPVRVPKVHWGQGSHSPMPSPDWVRAVGSKEATAVPLLYLAKDYCHVVLVFV